ncbi:putative repressor Imm [Mycoplasma phage MAV1]|uniref:Bacteriophage MAV1 immunity protein Imm n=2 Tax=Metamycoplasma arthritidis TaxID=2111 RepID=B3PNB5_META1|nr:hypothetical protein [Metamycoplasma arthritidis]NP_047268.1 putative repressor Imm [Mycoplasma phage MAV1]AAC33778.1 putative repressor Imm [Mycoplasma phage MAV1]AAT66160.1 Imm [Mycoplasma phage MAV1] [Metamycoplasma arthritidis]ACF07517.1 bacteriophage MAV1 immunity protein Imm [Metamycoplasma arthritidis 158L3-1]
MDVQTFQIVISVIVGTLIPALGTFIVLVINSLKKYKLAIITAKKGNEELVAKIEKLNEENEKLTEENAVLQDKIKKLQAQVDELNKKLIEE